MKLRHTIFFWALVVAMGFVWSIGPPGVVSALGAVQSPLVLVDKQHVDIEVPIIGGVWTPKVKAWYDGDLPAERSLLILNSNTQTVRSSWDSWIGAEDGQIAWVIDQLSAPNELWLGMAARGCDSLGSWLPDDSRISTAWQYIQVDMLEVRGYDGDDDPTNNPAAPGYVSLWDTDSWGTKTPWFSTAETLADGNRTYMIPGGHSHFYWAFTAEGIYEMDIQPRTYLGPGKTNLSVGPVITLYFGVERPFPGDANLDDQVNADDAAILATHWGTSGTDISWLEGDFNNDHLVNAIDASILAANWGCSGSETTAIPEPGTAGLFLTGIVVGLTALRKRDCLRPSNQ